MSVAFLFFSVGEFDISGQALAAYRFESSQN
jgi:hypothetical protein